MPLSHTIANSGASAPPSDIYVQVDTTELQKLWELSPKKMAAAARRAATRTRDWLMTQMTRELMAQGNLPKWGVRGRVRRGPKDRDGQYFSDPYAILWIGLNAIEAQRAGTPKQTKKGVKAGRHFFDRAFLAQIYSGTTKVWRRKGAHRLPVIKMTVPISEAMEKILPKYESAAARMFEQRLEHEINRELGIKESR